MFDNVPESIEKLVYLFLKQYPELSSKRLVVGYSGGRDSRLLLQVLFLVAKRWPSLNLQLKAIHVNHQINIYASHWAAHCAKTAADLHIPFEVLNINLDLQRGESLEAKAREARYQAILKQLETNDVLLTAHTQDDQAETLLLQLIRGAGVQGLSAMGQSKAFGHTVHYRPLLSISREQIEAASLAYSLSDGMSWITDDSNFNNRFDRNFIRHDILPILKKRFPGVVPSLARSAQWCQEAASVQQAQAQLDFETINQKTNNTQDNQLNGAELMQLPVERQKAVIRYWIAKNNVTYPSKVKLEDIVNQINNARSDAMPCISWNNGSAALRRYKQNWYLYNKTDNIINNKINNINNIIHFKIEKVQGRGFNLDKIKDINALNIRYRGPNQPQKTERCKPAGALFSKSLKKWMQILEIPTWMRNEVPLVYYQDTLVGVLGHFICEGWQVIDTQDWGIEITRI